MTITGPSASRAPEPVAEPLVTADERVALAEFLEALALVGPAFPALTLTHSLPGRRPAEALLCAVSAS
jgi:hypothetical protein